MKVSFSRVLVGAALLCLVLMNGCSGTTPASSTSPSGATAAKKVMLVVSFGTSYNDNRELSIGAIEKSIATAYPDYEVRRAFTSQIIIDKLAKRDGTHVDTVDEAMRRIVADGVTHLVIQPTTIMAGYEYTDIVTVANRYSDQFTSFAIGSPLLTTDDDFQRVAKAITDNTARYAGDDTAVIFMGHGTSAPSNDVYAKLDGVLKAGYKNYFVGTVEGSPTLEDVVAEATRAAVKKVVLQPFMVVAGDHATNDMAGDEPDSWKSTFTKAGFEVETLLEGIGQNPQIQQLYVEHAKAAVAAAHASTRTGSATPAPAAPSSEASAAPEVAPGQIKPGTYAITVTGGSSMFKIVDARLTVEGETMTVTVTLSGDGYGRLALGTGEQAAKATSGFIEFTTDAQGRHVYVVPVSRLNKPMSIAAESGKKPGTWYDQTVTFSSSGIPADAISEQE